MIGAGYSAREKKPQEKKKLPPADGTLMTVMVLLILFGLLTLFSATYYVASADNPFSEMKKQLLGLALGIAAMNVTMRIPYRFWGNWKVVLSFAGVSVVLLLLVIIPGVGRSINGSRRWLAVGGLSFQPGEFAKYAAVLFLALFLTVQGKEIRYFWKGIVPMLVLPGVMFLLILEQPNLSTAGTIIIVSVVMIMLAGARWKHMGVLGIMGAVLFGYYAWSAEYRRERLLSFMDPFAKMSDEGYQLSQSLIAFGSGGLFGMGIGQGRQKFAYLPYPESDFIFAIVGEDFGLTGCLAVILLFLCFFFCGLRVAVHCPDQFGCLLAAGIVSVISVQAFINMGVVGGILPTTGLPLPFFSAGGTSLSITLAAMGIVLNISRYGSNRLT